MNRSNWTVTDSYNLPKRNSEAIQLIFKYRRALGLTRDVYLALVPNICVSESTIFLTRVGLASPKL